MQLDLTNFNVEEDTVILFPQRFADGETGEELHTELVYRLRLLAVAGYWPVDWMEEQPGDFCALWFKYDPANAQKQTEFFIRQGGYV